MYCFNRILSIGIRAGVIPLKLNELYQIQQKFVSFKKITRVFAQFMESPLSWVTTIGQSYNNCKEIGHGSNLSFVNEAINTNLV